MEILPFSKKAVALADSLVDRHAVPPNARDDAVHIALAATNHMDLLLTWNHRHIANATKRRAIVGVVEKEGFAAPLIVTPEEVLEESDDS